MRRLLFITICLMVVTQLTAGPVTADQARQKASQFLNGRVAARARGSAPTASELKMSAVGKDDSYYIFNAGNNDGFVVVSGEDATEEILGYSDTGSIDPASMPCNMRMLFDMYTEQIKYLREKGIPKEKKELSRTRASDESLPESFRIDKSRRSKFDQHEPYNDKCPVQQFPLFQRSLTGCVATAMAGLMYAYKWPKATTKEIPSYGQMFFDVLSSPKGSVIDWDKIIPQYGYRKLVEGEVKYFPYDNVEPAQQEAVATLMRLAGTSIQTTYGANGSSGNIKNIPFALREYFGYDGVYWKKRENGDASWNNRLKEELFYRGPVIYRGVSPVNNDDHAFLLEGWEGDYFYINFGHSGYEEYKCLLNTTSFYYADDQEAIFNVRPIRVELEVTDLKLDKGNLADHTFTETNLKGNITFHNKGEGQSIKLIFLQLHDVETGNWTQRIVSVNMSPDEYYTYRFSYSKLTIGHHYVLLAYDIFGDEFYRSEEQQCVEDAVFVENENDTSNENIASYEYWFDDNFADRKEVSLNSSSAVVRASIETAHLENGIHKFSFRLRRADNKYSAISNTQFLKMTKEKEGHLDYWIDDDIDNRISLPIEETDEEQELTLDLSKVPTGYHRVNMQVATPGSVAGTIYSEGVMKLTSGVPNELEYWFDNDFKNSKRLTGKRTSSDDGYIYDTDIDMSGLTQGLHRLNIRATSSGNTRGSVLSYDVLKFATGKATKLEYWFDDDQTNIKLLDGKLASDGNDYIFDYDLDMSKLTMGLHRLNIRPSSGQGSTSGALISTNVFKLAAGVASKLEYWFDDDLEGSQKLDGKLASDGKDYIFSNELNLSSLPLGMHRLNIRATDAEGTNLGAVFSYDVLKLASGKATRLEYWFDGDKEHSRLLDGTASDTGVNDYVFVKDLNMSCLEPGHHRLFYRSVSESGMTSGAISETPIIVKSRYNVSDPTTLDVTRYSFWVDNESNPEVMDVEDPTYGKTFRHELDARNLKEGDHVVHLKFWNSMGVAVSEEVPFKAVQVDNPSISLTAEEKNGEVTVRFNTVAYDMSYTLYRKNESGVKTMIATKGSCYPTNLVWRGTLPAGSYTYYVECVYTDKSGNEQTLTSNEATVSIAKTVTIAYGSITGILMTDGAMLPSSGVSVVLTPTSGESRTVKVDTYGKFICEKLPLNSQWTLTVTGDDLHEFDAKTVIIEKEGNLTVKLSGKQKEESEEERITKEHDLALNSTLDCAQNLAFEVKNLSSSKWTGTIEVVAIRKDKMYNFYDNQIPLPVTTELTIKGNDTQQIYIPLEALGRLNKDREYNFKFTTKGKYDTYYSYYRERPLYLAKEYSEDGWYVTQLVEKDRHNQDNIPWTTEQSVYFANLLVKLHSLIGGMNGKIGDADQFRSDVVKAAKALTGKYDEKEAVEGMIRWMEGKNALEILANPTIATLSEALTFASPVSASLPLSLKSKLSYAIDGATKAMDYLNGVIAVYDFVKAESDYEKFFVCANWICNVASKTNPLYSILMNSYLVVSKSMITKVIEMGEKLYKRKEAQLLQMNELSSSDGYKYATINKQIDFKIRVKKSGKGYFTPAEIIKQIDYVEAKVSNNSNSPDVVTFKMVEDGDYVALKQTAYNGGGVDDGFNLKQFDLEIHWNNKRVTMVPLAEGDGVDFDKGSGSSDERYIKPACYTIVFKSDSNTPESMGEFIHLK